MKRETWTRGRPSPGSVSLPPESDVGVDVTRPPVVSSVVSRERITRNGRGDWGRARGKEGEGCDREGSDERSETEKREGTH